MRIWDIPPRKLCRNHLLGEHSELHAIWSVITKKKTGYAHHPEVLRWKGKLKALYLVHEKIVKEMERRGYSHRSPLPERLATCSGRQTVHVDSVNEQIRILKKKGCDCETT
jgi:hypothetical protein